MRGRVLDLFDARTLRRIGRADAGSGPVQVASDGGNYLYVTDAIGGSVLVFHPAGAARSCAATGSRANPWAIVHDAQRRRLWVTLAGAEPARRADHGRAGSGALRDYASVAQPSAVAVEPADGVVGAAGATGRVQVLEPRTR